MSSALKPLTPSTPLSRKDLKVVLGYPDDVVRELWALAPKRLPHGRRSKRLERVLWGDIEALLDVVPPDPTVQRHAGLTVTGRTVGAGHAGDAPQRRRRSKAAG